MNCMPNEPLPHSIMFYMLMGPNTASPSQLATGSSQPLLLSWPQLSPPPAVVRSRVKKGYHCLMVDEHLTE